MKILSQKQIDELAIEALRLVQSAHGTYVCKCLFVNGIFSKLLKQAGIENELVSGQMAGGFNTGDNDSFRYGYTTSFGANLIDHHVWVESSDGQIYDAMLLVMDEEMQITSTSEIGEFLLPKTSVISPNVIRDYDTIMDEYEVGLHYQRIDGWHSQTVALLEPFIEQYCDHLRSQ